LVNIDQPQPLDLSGAKATASSLRDPLVVQSRKLPDEVQLYTHLPGVLPSRTHTFNPSNAIDGSNFTEWWAAPEDSKVRWQLDPGSVRELNRCEIFFAHSSLGQASIVEKSLDGQHWQIVRNGKKRIFCSPHKAQTSGKVRYLRIHIKDGTPAIWEVKLY